MRFGRVRHEGGARWVRVADDGLRVLARAPWEAVDETGAVLAAEGADVLAPVAPGKVVCVGRNYGAHARELGNEVPAEPLLFLKPPSAVVGPGAAIALPPQSARVDHEAELAVVIGRTLRDATEADARAGVFGWTCANDVTARDLQKRDVQFTRAKGFDTFCPLGPWVATEAPPADARVVARVNGQTRQDGTIRDLIFPVPVLLAYISAVMTLEPGDVVLTGTPEGVGPLAAGDDVEVEITGLGVLRNRVTRRQGDER